MKNYQKALKHTVNILAAVLFGAVAFVFIAYGLAYKSLPFIDRHFMLLLSLSLGVTSALILVYLIFYIR